MKTPQKEAEVWKCKRQPIKNHRQHKWAMIFSVLPDLDWLFIKISTLFGNRTADSHQPVLHQLAYKTLYSLPLLRLLDRLPNLRHRKGAAGLELVLIILLSGDRFGPWKEKFKRAGA